ncbi:Transcriptional regulator TACO1-like [Dillenia turbinata]|uniref:Transcriptional regulator TACO1-like n=1 Tax=Dillenia turbinata TaxID=194707 RepID=A0AAN8VC16_9MAGN
MASSSSITALGAVLDRFSNGVSLNCPNSLPRSGTCYQNPLSSSCSLCSSLWVLSNEEENLKNSARKMWTFFPLCMGRRSSKIATRKVTVKIISVPFLWECETFMVLGSILNQGAQDAKKAKLYSRIAKEIISSVKKGGPSPVSNTALATVLEKAKDLDVPREIVDRNIKRASEKGQEAYIEKIYEVYGFGGVGMVVEVLTDKINRSVAAVREVVKDCGGKMADPGSIMFKFKRVRVVNVKVSDADKDQLLAIALDAGAEDVIEPPTYDDGTDEDRSESYYKVVCTSENYSTILSKLREEGITVEPDNGSELLPITTIEVDDEAVNLNKELMTKLLELDDVDAVYTDQK